MSGVLRVLIASAEEATSAGIKLTLEREGFGICAQPVDVSSAIASAAAERPDVCLIDEHLAGGAIIAVHAIFQRLAGTRIVILTTSEEPRSLLSAIRAGASGYVRKDLDPTRLAATLRGVMAGEAAMSRRLTFRLMESLRTRERGRVAATTPGGPSITDRELHVLELMAEGQRTSQIAAALGIAEVTVRRHVSSAMAKLGVSDRAAAIAVLTGRARA